MLKFNLRPHSSNKYKQFKIKSTVELEDGKIILTFDVQKKVDYQWNTNSELSIKQNKNWQLWNHDVVELFIQPKNENNEWKFYQEIEISPLGQVLCLNIHKPRKILSTPIHTDFNVQITHKGHHWLTTLIYPIPKLASLCDYKFGLFAALGSQNQRQYYAINPNPQDNADFHLPEYFFQYK